MNRLDMLEAGRAALPFQLTTAQERVLSQVGCRRQGQVLSCAGLVAKAQAQNLSLMQLAACLALQMHVWLHLSLPH